MEAIWVLVTAPFPLLLIFMAVIGTLYVSVIDRYDHEEKEQ